MVGSLEHQNHVRLHPDLSVCSVTAASGGGGTGLDWAKFFTTAKGDTPIEGQVVREGEGRLGRGLKRATRDCQEACDYVGGGEGEAKSAVFILGGVSGLGPEGGREPAPAQHRAQPMRSSSAEVPALQWRRPAWGRADAPAWPGRGRRRGCPTGRRKGPLHGNGGGGLERVSSFIHSLDD